MDLQEIITLLGTIAGVVSTLGGIGIIAYRKQNKRLKESEAKLAEVNVEKAKIETKGEEATLYERQIKLLSESNEQLITRNKELVNMNAEKEDRHQQDIKDWEERFTDQTTVLRGVQRELIQANKDQMALTEEIANLKVELAEKRCDDRNCPYRLPPNAFTPPAKGVTKEQYHEGRGGPPRPSPAGEGERTRHPETDKDLAI